MQYLSHDTDSPEPPKYGLGWFFLLMISVVAALLPAASLLLDPEAPADSGVVIGMFVVFASCVFFPSMAFLFGRQKTVIFDGSPFVELHHHLPIWAPTKPRLPISAYRGVIISYPSPGKGDSSSAGRGDAYGVSMQHRARNPRLAIHFPTGLMSGEPVEAYGEALARFLGLPLLAKVGDKLVAVGAVEEAPAGEMSDGPRDSEPEVEVRDWNRSPPIHTPRGKRPETSPVRWDESPPPLSLPLRVTQGADQLVLYGVVALPAGFGFLTFSAALLAGVFDDGSDGWFLSGLLGLGLLISWVVPAKQLGKVVTFGADRFMLVESRLFGMVTGRDRAPFDEVEAITMTVRRRQRASDPGTYLVYTLVVTTPDGGAVKLRSETDRVGLDLWAPQLSASTGIDFIDASAY